MQFENISLKKFLIDRNIEFKDEYLKYDFMVIPNSTITIEDISLIKEIRENNNLVILNSDKLTYTDFRGGEYELVTFAVSEHGLKILIPVISNLLTYKITSYFERKKISTTKNMKIPRIRFSIHRTEKDERITIEGEVEDVLKFLDKLKAEKK